MSGAPASFVFDHLDREATHYFWVPDVARDAGSHRQWLRCRVRLHSMIAHSPASHFAIVLRAQLQFDAHGTPVAISGRGAAFGDTSLAAPPPSNPHAHAGGFGGSRGCQIESFWVGGNFLHRDSALLPEGLRDDVWYDLSLEVDDERGIELRIAPQGEAVQAARVRDRAAHPVIEGAQGVLIALGRAPHEHGPWHAEFHDIETGWR
jgi:hypothetical protein